MTAKELIKYRDLVCTVDVAVQLKNVWRFPTLFYWVCNPDMSDATLYLADTPYYGAPDAYFPAPLASEIKNVFPESVWVSVKTHSLSKSLGVFHFTKYNGLYAVSLMAKGRETEQLYEIHREEEKNEANACGLMYAYIFNNKLDQIR